MTPESKRRRRRWRGAIGRLPIVLASALLLGAPADGAGDDDPFVAGVQAYLEGDFEAALSHWMPLAVGGDPVAMYHVGMVHKQLPDESADPGAAAGWFLRAAQGGYAAAQHELGLSLSRGEGVAADPAQAVFWWQQAAEQGHSASQYRLARALLRGEGIGPDPGRARSWFEHAARAGDRRAVDAVARLDAIASARAPSGDSGTGDGEVGSALVGAQDEPAMADEAVAVEATPVAIDDGVRRDRWILEQEEDAFTVQLFASESEHEARQFIADNALIGKAAYYQSTDPARPWFKVVLGVYADRSDAETAVEGLPAAVQINSPWVRSYRGIHREIQVADIPEPAITIVNAPLPPDPAELQLSLPPPTGSRLNSDQAATLRRGQSAFNRNDYVSALSHWRPLAEQGVADAQYNLGFMHESGWGVDMDYDAAFQWYEAAARQGHTRAQFNLGLLYLTGDGVRANPSLGLYWVQTAADADDPRAAEYLERLRRDESVTR